MVEPGHIACGLHTHAEIDHVDDNLRMALWLHRTAHYAKGQ